MEVSQLKQYVSRMEVLCGAEQLIAAEGKAAGCRLWRMYNGRYNLFVQADKCMDIARLDYRGMTVSFLSKNGMVSPRLCNTPGVYDFVNGFVGGFLFTCGLDNIGAPARRGDRDCVQHGSLSAIPAEHVNVETGEDGGRWFVQLSGQMRWTALFGSHLTLTRKIRMFYDSDELIICDQLCNEGFTPQEYVLMYHYNIGYPALTEKAVYRIDSASHAGFNPKSVAKEARNYEFEAPKPGNPEEVYCHTLRPGAGKKAEFEGERIRIALSFDPEQLPYMTQWNSMASGDYSLGIEPATSSFLPEVKRSVLQPGESKTFRMLFEMSLKD